MVAEWTLLGFGFGNLAMLGWLAAAAAPLLIHLWSRRRYREMPWAAVSFLMAAMRKHSRRIQLEQWLLLAVRTLLILLVVLAVAEPYGEQLGGGLAGAPTHRVLVIDMSFSMAYREGDTTRLAKAQQLATELVDQSGPSDAFTLITLADPPRQLVGRDVADRRMVAERIDALTPSHGPANLPATLELVAAALALPPGDAQRFDRQEVHFFSDLQKLTWEPETAGADELRTQLAAIAERTSLHVADVGTADAANLAVTDLRASEPYLTVGRPVTFDATLREFGNQPRDGCTVEFFVDDVPVGQQTVDVPAGGETTVRFTHRFRAPGNQAVSVRAAADRLDIDNTRWLALPVKERVRVLCVGGSTDDAHFLADALDPERADDAAIRPTVITEGELAETDLAEFDCVFLSNVAQLTGDESLRLAQYVERGGGLAVFLGDRVLAESYNAATSGDRPLLPARLGEVTSETRFGLDPLDYRHPIVAPFRGRERAGLLSTPINRYFRLEVPDASAVAQAEVALAMPNGDPLIVTAPLGAGRVVLVATAGSTASVDAASGQPWTSWPAWPSFLPIVREVLAFAVGGQQRAWQTTVGEPIVIANDAAAAANSLEIVRPDGRKAALRANDAIGSRQWTYGDTDLSGIYTVRGADAVTHFAVNVDTRESDLAQADPQKLPSELAIGGDDSVGGAMTGSGWQRSAWQRSMLWSAFALVLLELCLAWRFGRGSA